jgi:hypothetical protein
MGAWRRQHDPDWQPDGTITVFNNNMHRGVSHIVKIDPKTYQTQIVFDGTQEHFYTWMRGKHEYLPSGHLSLISTQQGRLFEVNSEGKVVLEVINQYMKDKNLNLLLSESRFITPDFFHFNLKEKSKCSQ